MARVSIQSGDILGVELPSSDQTGFDMMYTASSGVPQMQHVFEQRVRMQSTTLNINSQSYTHSRQFLLTLEVSPSE